MPKCHICDRPIEGDVLIPEDAGPMHADCWVDWMQSQEEGVQGSCKIGDCPDDATHFLVFNARYGDRRKELYCEDHAALAARDAKDDPYGELFLGPQPLDGDLNVG